LALLSLSFFPESLDKLLYWQVFWLIPDPPAGGTLLPAFPSRYAKTPSGQWLKESAKAGQEFTAAGTAPASPDSHRDHRIPF